MAVAGGMSLLQQGPRAFGPFVPFGIRMRLTGIVNQMRDGQLPSAARYVPLRQVWTIVPGMTDAQYAALTHYILTEAGLLDSMNEMSEMTAMQLQIAMDRESKFVQALSKIMKKIDSTQETITQNLKG